MLKAELVKIGIKCTINDKVIKFLNFDSIRWERNTFVENMRNLNSD